MMVYIFKRKLPVAFIISIINVFTPVMHGKEISKRNVSIPILMFYIMFNKYGYLKQLLKQAVIKVKNKDKYVDTYFSHNANVSS